MYAYRARSQRLWIMMACDRDLSSHAGVNAARICLHKLMRRAVLSNKLSKYINALHEIRVFGCEREQTSFDYKDSSSSREFI